MCGARDRIAAANSDLEPVGEIAAQVVGEREWQVALIAHDAPRHILTDSDAQAHRTPANVCVERRPASWRARFRTHCWTALFGIALAMLLEG